MNTNHTATDPALVLDILAQLFASGSSLANGLAAVGHHLPGCQPLTSVANQLLLGVSWDEAWEQAREARHLDQLANELQFVHTSAVPSAHMLTTAATALRANRKRLAEQLAQELAIRLVLPTGICMLPSFILLGIVPMVLALLPG
ncbi:MAG TPA: type II secretion system F family protein [Candidatus Yaniella excrementavium]|nr:type II secretion system F family protein [Candidatus Yaniella excrementavium]